MLKWFRKEKKVIMENPDKIDNGFFMDTDYDPPYPPPLSEEEISYEITPSLEIRKWTVSLGEMPPLGVSVLLAEDSVTCSYVGKLKIVVDTHIVWPSTCVAELRLTNFDTGELTLTKDAVFYSLYDILSHIKNGSCQEVDICDIENDTKYLRVVESPSESLVNILEENMIPSVEIRGYLVFVDEFEDDMSDVSEEVSDDIEGSIYRLDFLKEIA